MVFIINNNRISSMMDEVRVSKETYDKMVGALAQMPYAQIAQLLDEVSRNTRPLLKGVKVEENGD